MLGTLVHEGGYGVTATDDGAFVFTRPDGRRIPECGARLAAHGSHEGSFRGNSSGSPTGSDLDPFERSLQSYLRSLKPDLQVDSRTGHCEWLGETMDYSLAIEGLQCLDGGWHPRLRAAPT